ncbi:MAG: 30S ribosomal protein S7 [Rickettsiales bacterium]|jgi:small subunit ribosomal protein S7|nr:30S ribosomal protein S7 [Rickettsiales bacterium]|tara:strand:- start:8859 stop:9326 length:468 start_codon:yes stop_codon:yes gene_type:complete
MRRKAAKIRKIFPDAKYNEVIISRFINRLMNDGKKSVVEKSLYVAFNDIEKKLGRNPIDVFKDALDNVTPRIEVRSRRIGGATYQIPVEVPSRRGSALALKWLKTSITKVNGRNLSSKIYTVIIESLENRGWAVKKREEVFKMAEANKAFSHYRW